MKRKKILWLCSWYPNQLEPFNGDFIKRHAEAVALFCDIHIIHIARDIEGKITKDVFEANDSTRGFKEKIIYYYIKLAGGKWIQQIQSHNKLYNLYKKEIKRYINEFGNPDLIHVHMGMKAGLAALWAKKQFGINYVVSEHWSGFLEHASEKFEHTPNLFQNAWKKILIGAVSVSAVSNTLASSIKKIFPSISPVVIPNVVNTDIFSFDEKKILDSQEPVFVHISGMQALKNSLQILKSFSVVFKNYPSARLFMIGAKPTELLNFVNEKGLENSVSFYEEMSQESLVKFLQQATALILVSSYETFGCVLIEANACGVPVIVSDIPVFHETVKQEVNGVFTKLNDSNHLANAMMQCFHNRNNFNRAGIAALAASRYSYAVVGKMFLDWYDAIIGENKD